MRIDRKKVIRIALLLGCVGLCSCGTQRALGVLADASSSSVEDTSENQRRKVENVTFEYFDTSILAQNPLGRYNHTFSYDLGSAGAGLALPYPAFDLTNLNSPKAYDTHYALASVTFDYDSYSPQPVMLKSLNFVSFSTGENRSYFSYHDDGTLNERSFVNLTIANKRLFNTSIPFWFSWLPWINNDDLGHITWDIVSSSVWTPFEINDSNASYLLNAENFEAWSNASLCEWDNYFGSLAFPWSSSTHLPDFENVYVSDDPQYSFTIPSISPLYRNVGASLRAIINSGLVVWPAIYDNAVVQIAYQNGYDKGYSEGWNDGKIYGQNSVTSSSLAIMSLFSAIIDIPIQTLNGLSPLAIWNVPIISIILTLLFTCVVIWVVKKFI